MLAVMHTIKLEPVELKIGTTVTAAKKPKLPLKKYSRKTKKLVMFIVPSTGATAV